MKNYLGEMISLLYFLFPMECESRPFLHRTLRTTLMAKELVDVPGLTLRQIVDQRWGYQGQIFFVKRRKQFLRKSQPQIANFGKNLDFVMILTKKRSNLEG